MKKIALFTAVFLLILLVLSWIAPVLFKDDILAALDTAIGEQVEAEVSYDPALFDIGLWRHFPHPTVHIGDIHVVNRAPFAGDTLLSIGRLGITVDLFSLLGSTTRIRSVGVESADLHLRILEDGTSNYDILAETDAADAVAQQEAGYSVGIDSWRVTDGNITYEDASIPIVMALEQVWHRGSGDFTQDVADMRTETRSERVALQYDGVTWLAGQSVDADMDILMNLDSGIYRFVDNALHINDLPLYLNGSILYDTAYMLFDLDFATREASIKSLYSLIPAAYTESYSDITAEGSVSMRGSLRGRYDDHSMPDIGLDIVAQNGRLRYPKVPQPISNIEIDAHIASHAGDYSRIEIDIPKFNMDIGTNPVRAALHIKNLVDYEMDADVEARVNLADLSAVFPMEGYTVRGILDLRVQAKGRYDSAQNLMPDIDGRIALRDGYVGSDTIPEALEQLRFTARLQSPGGSMEAAVLTAEDIGFKLGEDHIQMDLVVENFADYRWDAHVDGSLDLGMLSEYLNLENTKFFGKMHADMQTSGRYSDIERGDYTGVRASGTLAVRDIGYTSSDTPFGIEIDQGRASISPQTMQIEELTGRVGRSDIALKGALTGYLEYFLQEGAALKGNVALQSEVLDLNQWITGQETPEAGYSEEEAELESFALPKQVDLWLMADAQRIYYDNLVLQNARGRVHLHDSRLDLEGFSFNMLDGTVAMTGSYDTRMEDTARFAYQLDIDGLSIPEAFTKFESVQKFAPMARQVVGSFSTDFSLSGMLGPQLTPLYQTLNGMGEVAISNAQVKESALVDRLASLTGYAFNTAGIQLNDVNAVASVQNGRSYVKPFELQLGGHAAMISGSIGVDGSLDYLIDTDFDAGQLGVQFNTLVAGITGGQQKEITGVIPVQIEIKGTYDSPKLALTGTDKGVDALADQAAEQVEDEARKGIESLLSGDTAALQSQIDSLKQSVEGIESAGEGVKSILDNLFGNKKKDKKE
jgi:uncharacterized protein involved in outer membrane biogenesis